MICSLQVLLLKMIRNISPNDLHVSWKLHEQHTILCKCLSQSHEDWLTYTNITFSDWSSANV